MKKLIYVTLYSYIDTLPAIKMSSCGNTCEKWKRLNKLINNCVKSREIISFPCWQEIYRISMDLQINGHEIRLIKIYNKNVENMYHHPFYNIDLMFKILNPIVLYYNQYTYNEKLQSEKNRMELNHYKAVRCVNILDVLHYNLVNDITKYICKILSEL